MDKSGRLVDLAFACSIYVGYVGFSNGPIEWAAELACVLAWIAILFTPALYVKTIRKVTDVSDFAPKTSLAFDTLVVLAFAYFGEMLISVLYLAHTIVLFTESRKIIEEQRISNEIFESLDNAVDNDYNIVSWSVDKIQDDLQYCTDLSVEQSNIVKENIQDWLDSKKDTEE